jgi:hypothetical protein
MHVVNFLNSLSEVSGFSTVLSALRVTDNLSGTMAMTHILHESQLKGVSINGPELPERAMVANNGLACTCSKGGDVDHRSSDQCDHARHQSRHLISRYRARGGEHHVVFCPPDQLIVIVMSAIIVVSFVSSSPFIYRMSQSQGTYLYLHVKK